MVKISHKHNKPCHHNWALDLTQSGKDPWVRPPPLTTTCQPKASVLTAPRPTLPLDNSCFEHLFPDYFLLLQQKPHTNKPQSKEKSMSDCSHLSDIFQQYCHILNQKPKSNLGFPFLSLLIDLYWLFPGLFYSLW